MLLEGPVELLILQPTPFCNIDCSYCYLPGRSDKHRLSLDTLELACRRLLASGLLGDRLTVAWHAGEPLVLPTKYYADAFARIDQILGEHATITHSIQTNGTLLSSSWCRFIRHHRVSVGISLDGPASIHDAHRRTRAGRGTHASTMSGVAELLAAGIDFHVIAVLTENSLRNPDEMFAFFREAGVRRIGFNVEEIEGINTRSSLLSTKLESSYRAFLARFLELASSERIIVREFEGVRSAILGSSEERAQWHTPSAVRNHQLIPFAILTVDARGNFSTFSPELIGQDVSGFQGFVLGNVHRDSIRGSRESPLFRRIWREIQSGIDLCRDTCPYYALCGGGAPANKLFERGKFAVAETRFCRFAIQAPIDVVLCHEERRLGLSPMA